MDRLATASRIYNARKLRTIDMSIDMIPTIADKLLNYVYSSVKAVALPRFKVDNSVCVSKFKTIFEKGLHAKLNHGGI